MKRFNKSYLIVVLSGVLLVTGCANLQGGKVAQTNAADRVIKAYDVPALLSQAAPAVKESLENNLPDDVSSADRQHLEKIVDKAYEPVALQQDVVDRMRAQASEAKQGAALVSAASALESPLAQRMIALENKVGDPDFAQGFNNFIDKPASDARKSRLRTINGLVTDMQVVELQTDYNLTLLESMIRARNAAVSSENQVAEPEIKRMLSNTRDGIHGKLDQQVPLMLLYVYNDVDTDTLQQYAKLQARPALKWTNTALEQAIIQSLAAASENIPDRYKESN